MVVEFRVRSDIRNRVEQFASGSCLAVGGCLE
jgi:hypothetical protein